jgi:hypothetical protein
MQTTLTSSMEIHAVETDASGQRTGVFPITRNQAELDACSKQSAGAPPFGVRPS